MRALAKNLLRRKYERKKPKEVYRNIPTDLELRMSILYLTITPHSNTQ